MGDKIIPVKVALRIRPLVPKEVQEGCQLALEKVEGEPQVHIPNMEKNFTYDYAFSGNSTNEDVYEESVKPIVGKLFDGYNVTVLAYGQTGSGKTHSMGTAYKSTGQHELGVIPRAVKDIFDIVSTKDGTEFAIKVSFIELYNELLYDLLTERSRQDSVVDIREDGKNGIKIPGLTEVEVSSVTATMALLEKSSEGRITASTAMNSVSSRSHAIFSLIIEARSGEKCVDQGTITSKFHLVDLAGSERQKKTKAQGERLKEGININMGLLVLGNVISALGEENRGLVTHVPYRNSKLTRLLQDSLGGNSHTLMVACVSPADSNLEETISTLRYADRARKIKNKPIVNKDPRMAEINRLRSLVQEQQLKLQAFEEGATPLIGEASKQALVENSRLKEENGKLVSALQLSMEENTHMNEKMLMLEATREKLKRHLVELQESSKQMLCFDVREDQKQMVVDFAENVEQVCEMQRLEEKNILDHDASRFGQAPATDVTVDLNSCREDSVEVTTHTLKQSELSVQLNCLNKELAVKQQLVGTVGQADEKLAAMKKEYEDALQVMEEEIGRLQRERDELAQSTHSDGANDAVKNIAEQRRKKIKELEDKITALKKKQLEQQRLAKMAAQNEAKAKKYQEEIKSIKAAKVKLVKQMKEESGRVQHWKRDKEKEVIQLKQADRRTQVAMTKMSVKYERQQNVLKRRMEEVLVINKRLKDAQAKKASARTVKATTANAATAANGECIRGWVKTEMDAVVSATEAESALSQLIGERKMLTEELETIKADSRNTMTLQQMQDCSSRQTELLLQLDMRNAQISELQKEIILAQQDKERSDDDRWTRLTSMVDAKVVVSYLFSSATESMVSATEKFRENKELREQNDELIKNLAEQKEKITQQKRGYETDICRIERESEHNILVLLNQLYNKDDNNSQDVTNTVNDMFGDCENYLQQALCQSEELLTMQDEVVTLRAKVEELQSESVSGEALINQTNVCPKAGAKKQRRTTVVPAATETYTMEEYFEEFSCSESDESEEDADSDDDEWRRTATKKNKANAQPSGNRKQNVVGNISVLDKTETKENKNCPPRKSNAPGCGCKTDCSTKRCVCRKAGRQYCSSTCKCSSKCTHREESGSTTIVVTEQENNLTLSTDGGKNTTTSLLHSVELTENVETLMVSPNRKVCSESSKTIDINVTTIVDAEQENDLTLSTDDAKNTTASLLDSFELAHNLENLAVSPNRTPLATKLIN